ncbi:MAG: hypothetical protein HYR71_01495 [Chloroflexi bacterium]|nr:hypothetical protein [Chloroflexota bacterium]
MGLAARGTRNMDAGEEVVTDSAERAQARQQARRVYLKAVLCAVVLTALCWLI